MIDRDELAAWLRLLEAPRVGTDTARLLLAHFGSPQAVLAASAPERREVVGPVQANALAAPFEGFEGLLARTWAWLTAAGAEPRDAITLGDPRYPKPLLESGDPPLMFYVQGRIELLGATAIAVVGSRNPTPQGRSNAHSFAAALSRAGLTVVSGMALGVDGAAHEGALEGQGSTIAVVGTGLDLVYPRRHLTLARRIAREGLLVSEFSIGTPSIANNFPRRNRIIAGLSQGTLVVEAALQSGSLITARLAAESGREVFAIPGSIHSPQSRGCHALLKQGAKLVEQADDVLEELRLPPVAAISREVDAVVAARDPLLDAMGFDPITLDALVARTGSPAHALSARLLELELEGHVARLPGQLFQRIAHG